MQYLKLGFVKIPYQIKIDGDKKSFHICGIKIPFSTYMKENEKYYRLFGISFRFGHVDKMFITQSRSNYMMKDQLTDAKITVIAKQIFKEKLGYDLNLQNPKTMNEKIFWLKLNYHNPLITRCCDKFAVKDYVNEKIGPGHVIPTIASWDKAEDIDFSVLPDQYVMKVNWSSGYNIIVKDASGVNEKQMRDKAAYWMEPEQNSYNQTFNWGYKYMKPVVYAEKYMEQFNGQLYDYKFYCCNGKTQFLFIATDRAQKSTLTYDFFDMDFNHLDFTYGGRGHSNTVLEKPRFYDEMVRCAEILAKPFPFVRVDFYETPDNYYVGEMTFYSGGGILSFEPKEWDAKLGEYINLSKVMRVVEGEEKCHQIIEEQEM